MNKILSTISGERIKGVVSIVAAVVMYFTPDQVDHIIEGLLGALGLSCLVVNKKD